MWLLVEHADDLIARLVDEDQLVARSAALAGEAVDVIDPADEAEAVHALVEVADVHAGLLLVVPGNCLGLALEVDLNHPFAEREGVLFGGGNEAVKPLDFCFLLFLVDLALLAVLLVS